VTMSREQGSEKLCCNVGHCQRVCFVLVCVAGVLVLYVFSCAASSFKLIQSLVQFAGCQTKAI